MHNIGDPNLFVFVMIGGAIATWVWIRWKWLPDPPPPAVIRTRYLAVLLAGIVGSVIGGYLGAAGSNPMPSYALLGAGTGALIAAGAVAILSGARSAS